MIHPSSNNEKLKQNGAALLLVVLLLAILVPVITLLSYTAKTELAVSRSYRGRLQNRAGIDSALNLSRNTLMMDTRLQQENSPSEVRFDAPSELWATPFGPHRSGEAEVAYQIVDEARRVNVNWIVTSDGEVSEENPQYNQARRLFEVLNLDPQLIERLASYLKLSPSETPGVDSTRRYLLSPHELKRVNGFSNAILYGDDDRPPLLRYVTTWPIKRSVAERAGEENDERTDSQQESVKRGLINVNTARRPVLQSLLPPGQQRQTVVDLIRSRRNSSETENENRYFHSREELLDLASDGGVSQEVLEKIVQQTQFHSRVFSVFIRSRSDGVTETARVVLKRSSNEQRPDLDVIWFNRGVSLEVFDVLRTSSRSSLRSKALRNLSDDVSR